MTVELKPEQERMIQEHLTSARLPHKRRSNHTAIARMIEFSRQHSVKLPPGETVEDLVREGHCY
jgi:hypothetical protein